MFTDYITGFRFALTLLPSAEPEKVAASLVISELDGGFKEINGLSVTTSTEEVASGGENRFKYKLPQHSTYPNLELKRGVLTNSSPLSLWVTATMQSGYATKVSPQNLLLLLLDGNDLPSMAWIIVGAYPVKWSGGELNADKNEVFIETIELAYKYFINSSATLGQLSEKMSGIVR